MKKRSILLVIIFFISIIILSVNINNKYLVKEESLATFIDGERTDSFPAKGTVAFSKADCDNNTNIEWDNDNWGLYVTNLSNKVKCNIYFKTGENAVTKITSLASSDTTNMASDDSDNNIRYIGANPNNYVYFNCSDYANQTSETCEKWRIIGIFNSITKEDGTQDNLIKIVRNESIGEYSWDSNENYGTNDWTISDLMKLLNGGYENFKVGGSLYWNAQNGNCYYYLNNSNERCNFQNTGLKNHRTKDAIENIIWKIGGVSNVSNLTASEFYMYERGELVYNDRKTKWLGKIATIYVSDYGYAVGNNSNADREKCLNNSMNDWNVSDYDYCKNNNYLYNKSNQWVLTPLSTNDISLLRIFNDGSINAADAYGPHSIYPSLYLKSNILITGGNGSSEEPYMLGF